jgi:hypothetical protein
MLFLEFDKATDLLLAVLMDHTVMGNDIVDTIQTLIQQRTDDIIGRSINLFQCVTQPFESLHNITAHHSYLP